MASEQKSIRTVPVKPAGGGVAVAAAEEGGNTSSGTPKKGKGKKAAEPECILSECRIKSIFIKNFRCIGEKGVTIDVDDIVVLVGPNNVGKSSILRAYEAVMAHGTKEGKLTIDDFPGREVDEDALPQVTLETYIKDEDLPGAEWILKSDCGKRFVRERWLWKTPNAEPERVGWDINANDWSPEGKVPWGAPNVAKARRPVPHRVGAFDSPEKQAEEISKLIKTVVEASAEEVLKGTHAETYAFVREGLDKIQDSVKDAVEAKISEVRKGLGDIVGEIFPGYIVEVEQALTCSAMDERKLFASQPELRVGPEEGHKSTLAFQGSGARRTMLWAALKVVSEQQQAKSNPSALHVLMLDEPEICLHPNAIREACRIMYGLPEKGGWQVLVTTHSPMFIDLARDNTTIVRVGRDETGEVSGTTIYRPSRAKLDDDDKKALKLLNLCDPHVYDFFFGGRTVVVEGDTEYTAFGYMKELYPEEFRDVHVVRARGKGNIPSMMKILNAFGSRYAVLHDSDSRMCTRKGKEVANPAWGTNASIFAQAAGNADVRVVCSLIDFENAYFDGDLKGQKPYSALQNLRKNREFRERIYALLKFLTWDDAELPETAYLINDAREYEALPV